MAYTGGSYFFNTSSEEWEGVGLDTLNTTKELTGFTSNHLTSFGTGFAPQANNIDFKFIFAHASFSDNMTIFVSTISKQFIINSFRINEQSVIKMIFLFFILQMLVILTFLTYFCVMIYAILKDRKDVKKVSF